MTRQNLQHKKLQRNNKSGVTGVSFHASSGLWGAAIGGGSNKKYLGRFKTKDEAIEARLMAEQETPLSELNSLSHGEWGSWLGWMSGFEAPKGKVQVLRHNGIISINFGHKINWIDVAAYRVHIKRGE